MRDYSYDGHYDLVERLDQEERLIPSKPIYPFDMGEMLAAALDALAQPLPNGVESPFSSRGPTTGHSVLMSQQLYFQSVLAHEFNLTPDLVWLNWFRICGIERAAAEYPVVNIVFERSPEMVGTQVPAVVPVNIEVRSKSRSDLSAYTLGTYTMTGNDRSVTVPARLNQIGPIPDITVRDLSVLPRSLSFIASAYNDGTVVNPGRNAETLVEMMLRMRRRLRRGQRCVSDRDYYEAALDLGATKVNVLKGIQKDIPGRFRDLFSLIVYPDGMTETVRQGLLGLTTGEDGFDMTLVGDRLDVQPAEVIPIDGVVRPRVLPHLTNTEVFNLVATAMVEKVNPPFGKWGDQEFDKTVAIAIETQEAKGIYAVPTVELKHAVTNEPLSSLEIQPWHLLEIQSTLVVEPLR